jgi:MscS family membrane protein
MPGPLAATASSQEQPDTGPREAAAAQPSLPAEPGADAPAASAGSPRESVANYLRLARARDYEKAARYLVVPAAERERAAMLAERLKAVLDRRLWLDLDLDLVSGQTEGDVGDGWPAGVDRVGSMAGSSQSPEPVVLVRRTDAAGVHRAFSRDTVARVDHCYGGLADRWLRERLPAFLLRAGPHELPWRQMAGTSHPVVVGLGRRVTARPTHAGHLRPRHRPDPGGLGRLLGPAAARTGHRRMDAGAGVRAATDPRPLRARRAIRRRARGGRAACSRSSGRPGRASRWASLLVATLAELGYPVAGLLAGRGIGGLALALAAQKTMENRFGSLVVRDPRLAGIPVHPPGDHAALHGGASSARGA